MGRSMGDTPIAIDLLWVRPGKVGGTEPYIRNLLKGMCGLDDAFRFVLICSKDNADTFEEYLKDDRITRIIANVESAGIGKRIIWQSLFQNGLLRKNGIRYCFTPVYCRPVFNGGIRYINTIHDIQAYHYPQYHPLYEVWFSKLNWIIDRFLSDHIIAISEFVKKDLMDTYHFKSDKIDVIYNPILIDKNEIVPFEKIGSEYGISQGEYYYSASQLIPHKNFITLIKVFEKIKKEGADLPCKLVVSGIRGNAADDLNRELKEKGMEDCVIFTGFVDNAVRNSLYANCRAFLFPSVFEGFGMTPIEAMYLGARVITTKCASIPEVTQNKAWYVDDPYDPDEWISKMKSLPETMEMPDFDAYDEKRISKEYLEVIKREFGLS